MIVRSKTVLDTARGQDCTLRFEGICNYDPATVVSCHVRDRNKGMGIKASDLSICFGCSACHAHLDEGGGDTDYETLLRAMQETIGLLVRAGAIIVKGHKER